MSNEEYCISELSQATENLVEFLLELGPTLAITEFAKVFDAVLITNILLTTVSRNVNSVYDDSLKGFLNLGLL